MTKRQIVVQSVLALLLVAGIVCWTRWHVSEAVDCALSARDRQQLAYWDKRLSKLYSDLQVEHKQDPRNMAELLDPLLRTFMGAGEHTIAWSPDRSPVITIRCSVKYDPQSSCTFEIVGTDIKGVSLDALPRALRRHKAGHPNAHYEVLVVDHKCSDEREEAIIAAAKASGIELKHLWALWNNLGLDHKPGPHGWSYVDLLELKRATSGST